MGASLHAARRRRKAPSTRGLAAHDRASPATACPRRLPHPRPRRGRSAHRGDRLSVDRAHGPADGRAGRVLGADDVKVTLWGTRGSIAAPGVENARYGGNTACVEVRGDAGTLVVLDAGTGLRRLGAAIGRTHPRIDLLLTHLHMDHIQGLGFFAPLFDPDVEVHIWGPATPAMPLRRRLMRYLAPPLFPVHLRDVPNLVL